MSKRPMQFGLSTMLVAISSVAVVLGAARGSLARDILVACCCAIVLLGGLMPAVIGLRLGMFVGATAVRFPGALRRRWFCRKWLRLRPGLSSAAVRSLLGTPSRIHGFGDRIYWLYSVAGQSYTLSLDPRRLLATYSNGLTCDRCRIDK